MEAPQLNEHKQSCDSASAKEQRACIMPSVSKFAKGKAEYPPMHNGEFNTSHPPMHNGEFNTSQTKATL